MPLASIAPTGKANIVATNTSQNVLMPVAGTPTTMLVTNISEYPCFVTMGTSNAVVATAVNGALILPEKTLAFTIGSNTYVAVIGQGNIDFLFGT